ncbi:class I SAM-dependent methyltransferase [Kordiimonas sp. SCSIO 12603]|uniref:class I SAM-dependent methyltransferase n=1 Tax=Kordiimonas sp. SCSIO 12603 TaxID=2829596 RepID=UPI002102EE57|nr:class I SAM-dependent methyltransferase [Kordiimonas sp. SCSIO 12603]UTW58076.1 class I SAM-dependent methyltransferase [Kordiimonas sp. SCSIO 12603]
MLTGTGTSEQQKNTQVLNLIKESRTALAGGDLKGGLANLLTAFEIKPEDEIVQTVLFDLLSCTQGYVLPRTTTDKLAYIALQDNQNIQALAMVLRNQLAQDIDAKKLVSRLTTEPSIDFFTDETLDLIDTVFSDHLLQLVAAKTTCISEVLEDMITGLRKHSLALYYSENPHKQAILERLQVYLSITACQCFNTEYVFSFDDSELTLISRLLEDCSSAHEQAGNFEIILLANYSPILSTILSWDSSHIETLITEAKSISNWTLLLWQTIYSEPVKEQVSIQSIPVLDEISNEHSVGIADQYNSFPYPRWQTTKTVTPASLKALITELYGSDAPADFPAANLSTLYAGCGTGEQVLKTESMVTSEKALAVDLSKASLAYAQRVTQDHKLENVHYACGDILNAPSWDASFDLIVCTGVLHHMKDPLAGLQSLKSVSKPHSLFHLALYSTRARENVREIREYINAHNIPGNHAGIRAIREMIKDLPTDHKLKSLQETREFYSISGFHDYIFNIHEITYTPLEVKDLLASANLKLLGIDGDKSGVKNRYLTAFPDDPYMKNLDNWEEFEKQNPDCFSGMMHFWACHA